MMRKNQFGQEKRGSFGSIAEQCISSTTTIESQGNTPSAMPSRNPVFPAISARPRWFIAALVPTLCEFSPLWIALWCATLAVGAAFTAPWLRGPGKPPATLSLHWIAVSLLATTASIPLLATAASGSLAADWRSIALALIAGSALGLLPLGGPLQESGMLLILGAFVLTLFPTKEPSTEIKSKEDGSS